VTQPGVVAFGATSILVRSLLQRGFYDPAAIPQQPDFSDPQLEALLAEMLQYRDEGLLTNSPSGQINFDEIPLMISQPFALSMMQGPAAQERAGALLPGGTAGLRVEGFGVSSGTTQPELAYELVKFLTNSSEVVTGFFSTSPARRSLVGVESDTEMIFAPGYSEENQAL